MRWRQWLARPFVPWAGLGLALLLSVRTLGFGLRVDDRVQRIFALGDQHYPGLRAAPHRLYDFANAPAQIERLRREGIVPWFADANCTISFFRPLSSLVQAAEYRWLGAHVWAMHALSLACYVALFAAVLGLYRRLFIRGAEGAAGPAEAPLDATGQAATVGLAAWMFALDHTHGLAISWLAQRNSLLAAVFGVLALVAHDRARRDGDRRARWVAPALVLLSLLSAEAGTATVAALVAHALTFEPRGRRASALWPYALAVVPWLVGYVAGGYGVRRSGMYLDVRHDPLTALPRAVIHHVTLLGTELGNPLTDLWAMAPAGLQAGAVAVSAVLVVLSGLAAWPLLARDRVSRFLGLASVLTLLPAAVTTPQTRLLLFASVFQLALLARVAVYLASSASKAGARWWRWLAAGVTGYGVISHAVLSPLLLPAIEAQMVGVERALGGLSRGMPDDPSGAALLVVPNGPDPVFQWYLPVIGRATGRSVPGRVLALANGTREVDLTGVDAHTLLVTNRGGFVRSPTDTLTRSPSNPLRLGETFVTAAARFEVTHLDEQGRADTVRVSFEAPLDAPSLEFRRWQGDTLVPLTLPGPGETVHLGAQAFLPVLVAASQGGGIEVPGR